MTEKFIPRYMLRRLGERVGEGAEPHFLGGALPPTPKALFFYFLSILVFYIDFLFFDGIAACTE